MADRIRPDAPGTGASEPNATWNMDETRRLAPLDELADYKIAGDDPDVRGWDVEAAGGKKIGEVHDLIVDTAAMKVRYLDVDVDNDVLNTDEDRHILVPVGCASLHEDDNEVVIDNITVEQLLEVPAFAHGAITRDFESSVRTCYPAGEANAPGRASTAGTTRTATPGAVAGAADREVAAERTEEPFYKHAHFDEDRFYGRHGPEQEAPRHIIRSEEELAVGRRARQAGEVEVRKHVETEHVKKQVPTRHEEVTVERHPASASTPANPEIREDEIRIPVMEEEVVVEKRVVPKEEIVIEKHAAEGEETVEADLRKERIDVDRKGQARVRNAPREERRPDEDRA